MALFQLGDFLLRSGQRSKYKIECDSLTSEDWAALAEMAIEVLPPFGKVLGVPRGGVPFAEALNKHCNVLGNSTLLIAEDVVTTGGSLERFRATIEDIKGYSQVIGIVAFARGPCPNWVTPLFQMRTKEEVERLTRLEWEEFNRKHNTPLSLEDYMEYMKLGRE